jgi:WD40 repeat protein
MDVLASLLRFVIEKATFRRTYRSFSFSSHPPSLDISIQTHRAYLTTMSLSPNGRHLLSGAADGSIHVFETDGFQKISEIPFAHTWPVTGALLNSAGTEIFSCSADSTYGVHELAQFPPQRQWGILFLSLFILIIALVFPYLFWN